MKRFLFFLSVIVFAAVFFAASVGGSKSESARLVVETPGVDLSLGVSILPFPPNETSVSGATSSGGYLRLSPISGVSYLGKTPPAITGTSSGKTIRIGRGIYFFHLSDIFDRYSVTHESFRISQIGRGAFYVDTTNPEEIRIFSVSALLSQELLLRKKPIAEVAIFPSTYFGYSPRYNDRIAGADVLRVSQLNTLRYVDPRHDSWSDMLFGTGTEARDFFDKNLRFGKTSADRFSEAYAKFLKLSETVPEPDFAEEFGWYFVNPEKQASLLKAKLIRALRDLALSEGCDSKKTKGCPSGKETLDRIIQTLDRMEGVRPSLGTEGRELVRTAYYLSSFRTVGETDAYFVSGRTSDVFTTVATKAFPSIKIENGDYALLSAMYGAYYFGNWDASRLENSLDSYMSAMVRSKSIRTSEFLPFSFFLKEYLRREGSEMTVPGIRIAANLTNVSNDYYALLKDDAARQSILSFLYSDVYAKIFGQIGSGISKTFFEKTEIGTVLRPEYLVGETTPNLPDGFEKSLETLVKTFSGPGFEAQKKKYLETFRGPTGGGQLNAYDLLERSLGPVRKQLETIQNYPEYRQKLDLSEDFRNLSGIEFTEKMKTEEDIRSYLALFKGVDAAGMKVMNDPTTDWFYAVRVPILGKTFEFRLFPDQGNLIDSLVITDGTKKDERFKGTTVVLDDKKASLDEKIADIDATDPRRTLYLFENFFVNTYLDGSKAVAVTDATVTSDQGNEEEKTVPAMDSSMLLFVDRELIRKDFKNVADALPISIANVTAKTASGAYDITLNGVKKPLSSTNGNAYLGVFSGKYVFQTHEFYALSIRVYDSEETTERFPVSVEIVPKRIPLAALPSIMASVGDYVESAIMRQGLSSAKSVTLDFSRKKIIVNGVEYDAPVPSAP